MNMNLNINHLETFLAVCEFENFTAAAKQLFVPQPTVTNRINFLEEELGYKLFERGEGGKRTVKLTQSGKIFLPYAKQIIESLHSAQKNMLSFVPTKEVLRIGSTFSLTNSLIQSKINKLFHLNNDLNINTMYIGACKIIQSLIEKKIDMAFVIEPIQDKNFECYLFDSEEFELILSPEHPLAKHTYLDLLSHLKGENIIYYKPYETKLKMSILPTIQFNKTFITNQLEYIKNLIIHRYGVSFLPPLTVQDEIEKGDLISVPVINKSLFDRVEYYLVFRKNEEYFKEFFLSKLESASINQKKIGAYVNKKVVL
jgi:DNA-binding transcriptional LysR family regulator